MQLRDELVALTQRLVAIPSVSAERQALDAVIDAAIDAIQGVPDVRLIRDDGEGFPSLVVAFNDSQTADIILNAHLDVVPARSEQWNAYERDGRLYGRGTQDMKGAAAVYLRLIRDIAALPAEQRPNVAFQFVTDEEIGGVNGTGRLCRDGWNAKLFIAGEPTDMNICHGAKGILWIEIDQPGVPAHGSRPWEGINPIERLAEGLRRLYQRYPTPDGPIWRTTVTPAIISGGDAGNRVPAHASLRLDVRWTPEEGADTVIEAITEAFRTESEPHCAIRVVQRGSALHTELDDPHLAAIRQAHAMSGLAEPSLYREHFGSDARYYSERGVSAVCWGPVGSGLHTDDEWVSCEGLVEYYRALRALLGI